MSLSDSSLAIVCQTEPYSTLLLVISENGELLDSVVFSQVGLPRASILGSNGDIITAGYPFLTYPFSTFKSDINRIGVDGSHKWTKQYVDFSDLIIRSVIETQDGGYILTGLIGVFDGSNHDFVLMKVDANGDSLWLKKYNSPLMSEGSDLLALDDGSFFALGVISAQPGYTPARMYLVRFDSQGDTLWTRQYGALEYTEGVAMAESTTGEFVLAGNSVDPSDNMIHLYVVKVNLDGNLLWERLIGESERSQSVADVVCNEFGDAVVIGTKRIENVQHPYAVKLNANGNIIQ